jgi:hypothetical protein
MRLAAPKGEGGEPTATLAALLVASLPGHRVCFSLVVIRSFGRVDQASQLVLGLVHKRIVLRIMWHVVLLVGLLCPLLFVHDGSSPLDGALDLPSSPQTQTEGWVIVPRGRR